MDLLVYCAEPVLLLQVVWGVRGVREDCPPCCCLNRSWLLLEPCHFTDVLALAYLWLLVHFVVVTHFFLHDCAHQLVLVQAHALLQQLFLGARG